MVKETETAVKARKCSQCGHNGHNARTCLNGVHNGCVVKLFGVNISEAKPEQTALRKSLSLGNLDSLAGNFDGVSAAVDDSGYLSDGPICSKRGKATHEKKRGKSWTEEEHKTFLEGLKKLGKGDWRGISKKYVRTRTPTQVASHAQKYFLRLHHSSDLHKRRRSSLFDLPLNPPLEEKISQSSKVESTPPKPMKQASTSSLVKPQPVPRQSVRGNAQFEFFNRFKNLRMEYRPVFQTSPPYYSVPSLVFPPMLNHYQRTELVRLVHSSGLPAPGCIPIGMAPSQIIQASKLTGKDGSELQIGLPPPPPPPPQSLGGTVFGSRAPGTIHVK